MRRVAAAAVEHLACAVGSDQPRRCSAVDRPQLDGGGRLQVGSHRRTMCRDHEQPLSVTERVLQPREGRVVGVVGVVEHERCSLPVAGSLDGGSQCCEQLGALHSARAHQSRSVGCRDR